MSISDLLILSRISNVGVNRLRALVSHFGDPTRAMSASVPEIATIEGFSIHLATAVARFRETRRSTIGRAKCAEADIEARGVEEVQSSRFGTRSIPF
jgi:ERCC4-type nuclease